MCDKNGVDLIFISSYIKFLLKQPQHILFKYQPKIIKGNDKNAVRHRTLSINKQTNEHTAIPHTTHSTHCECEYIARSLVYVLNFSSTSLLLPLLLLLFFRVFDITFGTTFQKKMDEISHTNVMFFIPSHIE